MSESSGGGGAQNVKDVMKPHFQSQDIKEPHFLPKSLILEDAFNIDRLDIFELRCQKQCCCSDLHSSHSLSHISLFWGLTRGNERSFLPLYLSRKRSM